MLTADKKSNRLLSPRRQHNRDLMIQTILDTARAIMREEGVAALSMQELARRLDMRPPSLYNYFSGKMEIYDALFRLGFTLYAEQVAKTMQSGQSWQEELHNQLETYMDFAIHNPELYQLCFERPVPGFTPSAESLQVSFGLLQTAYERVAKLEIGAQASLSPVQAANLVLAMTHGLTALHMANEPHLPIGQGRFGSLIPAALSLFDRAWSKSQAQT